MTCTRALFLWVILLAGVVATAGCGTLQADYDRALRLNSMRGWEVFLEDHPRSQYDAQAKQHLAVLQRQARDERVREEELRRQREEEWRAVARYNETALKRLRGYQTYVTSTDTFFSDGWTGANTREGRIGIVFYEHGLRGSEGAPTEAEDWTAGTSCFYLGVTALPDPPFKGRGSGAIMMVQVLSPRETDFNCRRLGALSVANERVLMAPYVCRLSFTDGVLDSIRWEVYPDVVQRVLVGGIEGSRR